MELRKYQIDAVQAIRDALGTHRRVMLSMPTGSGKCLGINTPLIMADGTTRLVQDIHVGDRLMGPDGKGRNILGMTRGWDRLFCITPTKGNPYVVNSVHLLSLRRTPGSDGLILPSGQRIGPNAWGPVFVEAQDMVSANKTVKHCLKGWRPEGVNFENEATDHAIPPYILGVWLGDGTSLQPCITKPEGAVSQAFAEYAVASGCDVSMGTSLGKCKQWRITNRRRRNPNGSLSRSEFHMALSEMGLLGNKHIPANYIMTSRSARLEMLAGLMDTDGHMAHSGFDFIQKDEQMARDVVFLCRSVGLAAYTTKQRKGISSTGFEGEYWRVSISGDCSIIPCRDPKKRSPRRRQRKNHLVTGITVDPVGEGPYFGFTLDGDKQFLLGDWQVTHNTEVSMELIRGALAKGKKVAFLANRIHLIEQTSRRFARADIPHGIIQGSNTVAPWRSVIIASIQTLLKRGMPDVDFLVIDEAHSVAGTRGYRDILEGFRDKPVIGLSATPYSSGLGRFYPELGGALFEKLIIGAKIKDLINDGFLVDADIWAPSAPDLSGVRIVAGDYDEKQLGEAVDKPELIGDIVSHWLKLSYNQSTVVFATNIAHSKHIVAQFEAAGISAEHLDCYSTDIQRQETLERVSIGVTRVISNVGILCEGWDFPACRTLCLARPTRSLIRYLQMAGRVLRPYPGKDKALILDFSSTVQRLGFPWDDFRNALDMGKPGKAGKSKPDRPESLPTVCPRCHFVKSPKTMKCPACGFETARPCEIEHAEGELKPLTKMVKGMRGLEWLGKERVYHQLIFIGVEREYKDGWAANQFRDAFKCWPNGISRISEDPTGIVLDWVRSNQIRYAKARR